MFSPWIAAAVIATLTPTAHGGTITMDLGLPGLEAVPVEAVELGSDVVIGSGGSGGASVTRHPAVVTRALDTASPLLLAQLHGGAAAPSVVFTIVADDGQQTQITLGTVTFLQLQQADTAGGRAREQLQLGWQTAVVQVTPRSRSRSPRRPRHSRASSNTPRSRSPSRCSALRRPSPRATPPPSGCSRWTPPGTRAPSPRP